MGAREGERRPRAAESSGAMADAVAVNFDAHAWLANRRVVPLMELGGGIFLARASSDQLSGSSLEHSLPVGQLCHCIAHHESRILANHLLAGAADELVGLRRRSKVAHHRHAGISLDIALVELAAVPRRVHSVDARLAEILHRRIVS